MATEQQAILSVSLKDYKQQINDLKAAMLGLERESAEYSKIAEEVRKRQDKLNQVVADAKNGVKAAEGSYNSLVQKMSELRKVWKETGDEAKRNELGKQINSINEQLKGMDASIGNYQRNVGNYASAWTGAGDAITKALGSANPTLGTLASAVSDKLIPAIKGIGTQATATGAEVAAAEGAATMGISLIITAVVGLIAAIAKIGSANEDMQKKWNKVGAYFRALFAVITLMFQDVMEYVFPYIEKLVVFVFDSAQKVADVIGKVNKFFADSFVKAVEIANKALAGFESVLSAIIGEEKAAKVVGTLKTVGNAVGKYLTTSFKVGLAVMNPMLALFGKLAPNMDKYSAEWKKITEEEVKAAEVENNLIDLRRKNSEWQAKNAAEMADLQAKIQDRDRYTAAERQKFNEQWMKLKNEELAREKAIAEQEYQLQKTRNSYNESSTDDLNREQELKNKVIEIDTKRAEAERTFYRTRFRLSKQAATEAKAAGKESSEAAQNAQKEWEQLLKSMESAVASAEKVIERLRGTNASQKVRVQYETDTSTLSAGQEAEKMLLENSLEDGKITEEQYQRGLLEIRLKYSEASLNLERWKRTELAKIEDSENKKRLSAEQAAAEQEEETRYRNAVRMAASREELETAEREHQQRLREIRMKGIDDDISRLQETLNDETLSQELRDAAEEELAKRKMEREKMVTEDYLSTVDARIAKTDEDRERQKAAYSAMAKSTASLLGSVSDAIRENIEAKVKAGEITEEQAEKEFESTKKLEIAAAIINTISAAVAAYKADMKAYPAPYNTIMAGIDMAAALATGYAQVNAIKSTTLGGSTSSLGASGGISGVAVSPLLDERTDLINSTQLSITPDSERRDSRVYILESDLEDSRNRVHVRESNSNF